MFNFLRSPARVLGYFIVLQSVFYVAIGVFEIPLVLRLTSSIALLALVYILYNAAILAAFLVVPRWISPSRTSGLLKASLGLQALFCALVLVCYDSLAQLGLLCGLFTLLGFQEGVYWLARDSGVLRGIDDRDRDGFQLKLQSLVVLVSVVVPVVSGAIINGVKVPFPQSNLLLPEGYPLIFAAMLVVVLVGLLAAPRLRFPPAPGPRLVHSLALFRYPGLGVYAGFQFLSAAQGTVVVVGVTYLTFSLLKTEFNLAVFLASLSLLATVYFLVIRRLTENQSLRDRFILWGTVGVILSRLTFLFWFSFPGLILKSVFDTFLVPFKDLFADNAVKKRTEQIHRESGYSLVEIMIYQEILLFAARLVVLLVILLVLGWGGVEPVPLFQGLLLVVGLLNIVEYILLRRINRTTGD